MATRLREAQMAHADLQHGNVLLVPLPTGQLALRLIDYDGMHVPSLAGTRSAEVGHPNYQHPQRLREGTYSAEVDRFSHLAIYSSIRCLRARPELWQQFSGGDNLLFRAADFAEPGSSEVFRTLWALPNAGARAMVGRLALACVRRLDEVPLLEEVVSGGRVVPLERREHAAVDALLGPPVGISVRLHPPAIPTTPVEPPPVALSRPARRPDWVARGLRWATWPVLAPIRQADHLLGVMAGRENKILHHFLRVLAIAGVAVAVAFWIAQSRSSLGDGQSMNRIEPSLADGPHSDPLPRGAAASRETPAAARQAADKARQAAEKAAKAAEAAFRTKARPVCFEQGQQRFAEAAQAMKEKSFEVAGSRYEQAAQLFVQARDEAPIVNALGKAHEVWSAALAKADKKLLAESAPESFDLALEGAALAEAQAAAGRLREAPIRYGDALALLTRAGTEAAAERRRAETIARQEAEVQPFKEETNSIGMKLVLIGEGEFVMGSPATERGATSDARPLHRIRITRPFWMGKYEVTQEEYRQVMGVNPAYFKQAGPSGPVESVSWTDAMAFCRRLSDLPKEKSARRFYRLPTEAEWEYVCRAGNAGPGRHKGPRAVRSREAGLGEYAWFSDNSARQTHPVGQKRPNAWGVCDMSGKVWEWGADWSHSGG